MKNKIILLIEDSPDDEILTLRAFKKNNILNPIIVKRDGAEAIEFLSGKNIATIKSIAVILLDLKLPKIDGLEVLKYIRSNKSTWAIPVVVLTSSKEESDIIRSYKFGANSYIRKPIEFDEFMNAVNQMGLYWLILNEVPESNKGASE